MPAQVNMHEAKTHLSKLVEQVSHGDDVIICKSGKPVARLSAYVSKPRKPGAWEGRMWMLPDSPEDKQWLVDAFEGNLTDEELSAAWDEGVRRNDELRKAAGFED